MFRRLWKWIRRLFSPASDAIYRPYERLIYSYWDGKANVRADPLVLYKRLMDVGPELSAAMQLSTSISKSAVKGHDDMVGKIRGIFRVEPLEKGGLSELETVLLLDHFLVYCEGVKKNSRTSATTPNVTAASINTSVESPPIPNTSDSGSTENAPSTDGPDQPPSVSPSPSAS